MSDETRVDPMPRPEPPRSLLSRTNDWLNWFGVGRLVLAALSVVIVAAGAVWLLRAPTPSVESTLPQAGSGKAPASTLALPSTSTTGSQVSSGDVAHSTPTAAGPTLIMVHVAGAVAHPGVYNLASSARVVDAVNAAGGANPDADIDRVNLAAVIADGQRIFLPARGGTVPTEIVMPDSISGSTSKTGGTAASTASGAESDRPSSDSGPLDLNTATADQLELLPGIGPATAAAIVDDRDRNGPFSSVDDLDRVSGIGPAKLAALQEFVTV